jgi:hypothetical protein
MKSNACWSPVIRDRSTVARPQTVIALTQLKRQSIYGIASAVGVGELAAKRMPENIRGVKVLDTRDNQ